MCSAAGPGFKSLQAMTTQQKHDELACKALTIACKYLKAQRAVLGLVLCDSCRCVAHEGDVRRCNICQCTMCCASRVAPTAWTSPPTCAMRAWTSITAAVTRVATTQDDLAGVDSRRRHGVRGSMRMHRRITRQDGKRHGPPRHRSRQRCAGAFGRMSTAFLGKAARAALHLGL